MKRMVLASLMGSLLGAGLVLTLLCAPGQIGWAAKPAAAGTCAKGYVPPFSEWVDTWLSAQLEIHSNGGIDGGMFATFDAAGRGTAHLFYTTNYRPTGRTKTQWDLLLAKCDAMKAHLAWWTSAGYPISPDNFDFYVNNVKMDDFRAFRAFIQAQLRRHI